MVWYNFVEILSSEYAGFCACIQVNLQWRSSYVNNGIVFTVGLLTNGVNRHMYYAAVFLIDGAVIILDVVYVGWLATRVAVLGEMSIPGAVVILLSIGGA